MESDQPLGRSIVRTTKVGNEVAVNLLDLEAAAARAERVYSDPDHRWNAFRLMLDGLRTGMGRVDIDRRPDRG